MPAYSITEVEVVDADAFKLYREISQPSVMQYGGRFLVQGAEPVVAEGEFPKQRRIVIIEFASMEQLKTWYDSPEYRRAREIARTALRRRLLFVPGVEVR